MSSSGKTVKTIYQTGPDDELIVKDAYEGSKPYEGTKTGTSFDELRNEAIDTLEQLKEQADDLESKIAEVNEDINAGGGEPPAPPYSDQEKSQRLSEGNAGVGGLLNSMSQAGRSLFYLSPASNNIVSNGNSLNSSLGIKDLKAIAGIISNLAGSSQHKDIKDKGAATELIRGTAVAASNSGITDTYQILTKNPKIDRDILVDSAISSIKDTVATGNINTVLDVAKAGLLTEVVSKDPGVVGIIFSSPTIKSIPPNQRSSIMGTILLALNESNDDWNLVQLPSGPITDLKDNKISDQMSELLRNELFNRPLTVIAGNDTTTNSAIDVELTDPISNGVMDAIYGDNLTQQEIDGIVSKWNDPINIASIKNYHRTTDMYLGSLLESQSVQSELNQHFQYLNVEVNSKVFR